MAFPDSNSDPQSARARHLSGLAQGRFDYQFDEVSGKAVFYPREVGSSGSREALTWRTSQGFGTVYSWTEVHRRENVFNIVLVDMDDGFRLMSTLLNPIPESLRIGQRVVAHIEPWNEIHRILFQAIP